MKLEKQNSRSFQKQIFKNSLFLGFFKNHLQFKNNSRNSRTAGHPVLRAAWSSVRPTIPPDFLR